MIMMDICDIMHIKSSGYMIFSPVSFFAVYCFDLCES